MTFKTLWFLKRMRNSAREINRKREYKSILESERSVMSLNGIQGNRKI